MNDESPVPSVLPVVVPSPIGPAISYAGIRKVTSRAEKLLDTLDGRARKHIRDGLQDAGDVGAAIENKVVQRIGNSLTAPEQLFNDTEELLRHQIAANMVPSVIAVEDLEKRGLVPPTVSAVPDTAGTGGAQLVSEPPAPQIKTAVPQSLRAGTLASRLRGVAGSVAGGTIISSPAGGSQPPPAGFCPQASQLDQIKAALFAAIPANPPDGKSDSCRWIIWLDQDCKLHTADFTALGFKYPPPDQTVDLLGNQAILVDDFMEENQAYGITDTVAKAFKLAVTHTTPSGQCAPSGGNGIDTIPITVQPTCPTNPCVIDVTCPPPVINVPPCPPVDLQLPTCVMIDLCDWDKLCQTLMNCLVQSKEDCALDNDTAYTFKDCDGSFGDGIKDYMGSAYGQTLAFDNIDDLRASSDSAMPVTDGSGYFGPDPVV